ncbi:MAG TPA: GIY-YIG nuclease family protein [Mucilaginibacter sp.]|nr:GIY-YIG nuclease family protein [Mucilaginibacter sp.]
MSFRTSTRGTSAGARRKLINPAWRLCMAVMYGVKDPSLSFGMTCFLFIDMWNYNFYIYITTNPAKTVLYVGVTNDLRKRISQHTENRGKPGTFAGKFYCYNLVYYEYFTHIDHAIAREKEIKKWRREKKNALIESANPGWKFLNDEI